MGTNVSVGANVVVGVGAFVAVRLGSGVFVSVCDAVGDGVSVGGIALTGMGVVIAATTGARPQAAMITPAPAVLDNPRNCRRDKGFILDDSRHTN